MNQASNKQKQNKKPFRTEEEIKTRVEELIELTKNEDKYWKVFWQGGDPYITLEGHITLKITKKVDDALKLGIYGNNMSPYVTRAEFTKEINRLDMKITSEVNRLENKFDSRIDALEAKFDKKFEELDTKMPKWFEEWNKAEFQPLKKNVDAIMNTPTVKKELEETKKDKS